MPRSEVKSPDMQLGVVLVQMYAFCSYPELAGDTNVKTDHRYPELLDVVLMAPEA